MEQLPEDVCRELVTLLESRDVVNIRLLNKNCYSKFNVLNLLNRKEFFRFVTRNQYDKILFHPLENPFKNTIAFTNYNLLALCHLKSTQEIAKIFNDFGTLGKRHDNLEHNIFMRLYRVFFREGAHDSHIYKNFSRFKDLFDEAMRGDIFRSDQKKKR